MAVSELERELVLSVADGNEDALQIVFMIRQVCDIADLTHYFLYLQWLKKQNIVGLELVNWWFNYQKALPLNAVAFIRQKVFKDPKMRPLMSRQDI